MDLGHGAFIYERSTPVGGRLEGPRFRVKNARRSVNIHEVLKVPIMNGAFGPPRLFEGPTVAKYLQSLGYLRVWGCSLWMRVQGFGCKVQRSACRA